MSAERDGPRELKGCDEHLDQLGDLALGIGDPRERAHLLDHLESCGSCRAELDALSLTADRLLEVAPSIEPPLGFETRLFEMALQSQAPVPAAVVSGPGAEVGSLDQVPPSSEVRPSTRFGRRTPGRRRIVAIAAGCALLAGAAGASASLVATRNRGGSKPTAAGRSSTLERAVLESAGRPVGEVFVHPGRNRDPGFVFMSVAGASWTGSVTCEVQLSDGSTRRLGSFWVYSGSGSWGVPLPVPAASLTGAELVSGTGAVLATASLG